VPSLIGQSTLIIRAPWAASVRRRPITVTIKANFDTDSFPGDHPRSTHVLLISGRAARQLYTCLHGRQCFNTHVLVHEVEGHHRPRDVLFGDAKEVVGSRKTTNLNISFGPARIHVRREGQGLGIEEDNRE